MDVKILLSRITSLSIRFFSVYREGSIILVSYKEWATRTTVTNSVEGMNFYVDEVRGLNNFQV